MFSYFDTAGLRRTPRIGTLKETYASVCAANEFKFREKLEDRNFVLDNAKFKRPEVSDSDRAKFSARGKILFVDMETLPFIADTMRVECSYLSSRLS